MTRLLCVTVAVVLPSALWLAAWVLLSHDPVHPESFERIRCGMSVNEVETILERPGTHIDVSPARYFRRWAGERYMVFVYFDAGNRVERTSIQRINEPAWTSLVRGWLGL